MTTLSKYIRAADSLRAAAVDVEAKQRALRTARKHFNEKLSDLRVLGHVDSVRRFVARRPR